MMNLLIPIYLSVAHQFEVDYIADKPRFINESKGGYKCLIRSSDRHERS